MAKKNHGNHKTKKGTELPLIDLKGKPYMMVAHRLVWFVEENPFYDIKTQFIELSDKGATCQAAITIFAKDESGETKVVRRVTATKSETKEGFADFKEKAETGSIGRALALIGYGTQFSEPDLDEGTRLADSPVVPAKKSETKTTPAKKKDEAPKTTSFRLKQADKKGKASNDF